MTEVLGDEPVVRLELGIASALRRRPAHEPVLAGILRELAPFSPRLRSTLERVVSVLVKRGAFGRSLYVAASRSLAEHSETAVLPHLAQALSTEEAGGLGTLSAVAMTRESCLAGPLERATVSRHAHLAFAAEVARLARGESDAARSVSVAPKIKESHRISLCTDVFVPLLFRPSLPRTVPGLAVLRDSERHLGRWLVLAEVGARAGDAAPAEQALGKSQTGTASSRTAWALASWALGSGTQDLSVRPTQEAVVRLSHRPAAERDLSFLFRMGEAKLAAARPMLENMVKSQPLAHGASIRAALVLSRSFQQSCWLERLVVAARCHRQESLRGLAAAALFDLGQEDLASRFADELVHSKRLPTLGWAALIRAGIAGRLPRLVTEARFRRVQCGWSE